MLPRGKCVRINTRQYTYACVYLPIASIVTKTRIHS